LQRDLSAGLHRGAGTVDHRQAPHAWTDPLFWEGERATR
jgi:hypothetical protein